MKKSVVTLLAVAALGAVVAPVAAVKANDGVFNAPNTKVDYKVEELGLAVSTAKAKYDLAKLAHEEAGQNVTGREYTLAATNEDLKAAQADVQTAKELKAAIQSEYDRDLGLLNQGTPVEGFKDLSEVQNHYTGLLNAQDAEIAKLEGVVVTRQTAVDVAQADLNEYVALKNQAYEVLTAAKVELDNAIAAARAGGLSQEQVDQAQTGATNEAGKEVKTETVSAKKAANKEAAAKSVAPAKTATATKELPKTSAAK